MEAELPICYCSIRGSSNLCGTKYATKTLQNKH